MLLPDVRSGVATCRAANAPRRVTIVPSLDETSSTVRMGWDVADWGGSCSCRIRMSKQAAESVRNSVCYASNFYCRCVLLCFSHVPRRRNPPYCSEHAPLQDISRLHSTLSGGRRDETRVCVTSDPKSLEPTKGRFCRSSCRGSCY